MAESPSSSSTSTSQEPLVEKLGLRLLIPDTTLSDPTTADQDDGVKPPEAPNNVEKVWQSPEVVAEENAVATDQEEDNFRNAIEKEIFGLSIEQAEIEAARGRLVADGDAEEDSGANTVRKSLGEAKNEDGVGIVEDESGDRVNDERKYVQTSKIDDLDIQMNEKDSVSGEDENEIERVDEENFGEPVGEIATLKAGRHNPHNGRRRINYPMRPDADDCAYYMKFGSCKFGLNCKFNHPPRRKNQGMKDKAKHQDENSEKAGQTECKYYLTSGGCKFGKDCKYNHGSDKSLGLRAQEFNFLGLPIRLGEKECPYYMRTGSCKYGSNCKFHHPDPTSVPGGDSSPGYANGGSLPTALVSSLSVSSWSSAPVMLPPDQGSHTQNPEWNRYQPAVYPASERSLPTPPAFAVNNLPTEINFPIPHQNSMLVEEYPEHPGEPECSFFLKIGDCKFKSSCKFHHPKGCVPKARANASSLNDKGLPLRPDQPICTHYHRYGICKYGPACKYDHPSKFAVLPSPFDQPPLGNSKLLDGFGLDSSHKE